MAPTAHRMLELQTSTAGSCGCVARCACGWRTGAEDTAAAAVADWKVHRAEVAVQAAVVRQPVIRRMAAPP